MWLALGMLALYFSTCLISGTLGSESVTCLGGPPPSCLSHSPAQLCPHGTHGAPVGSQFCFYVVLVHGG